MTALLPPVPNVTLLQLIVKATINLAGDLSSLLCEHLWFSSIQE
jgi:hypothetical protein